jgi:hypothetical protein
LTAERQGWRGDRFLEPSLPRLEGGDVLFNVGAEPPGDGPAPCWMIRLFSDMRYADDLVLRIDLREFRGMRADTPLAHSTFRLGEPSRVLETPFMTSRYYYDVPLPVTEKMTGGSNYSLLLRMINAEGLTVSEEQQVKLRWPDGGLSSAAEGCDNPPLIDYETPRGEQKQHAVDRKRPDLVVRHP